MKTPVSDSFRPDRSQSGFTLIELLVVVAVVAVLSGMVFAGVQIARRSAEKAAEVAAARNVIVGYTAEAADNGRFLPAHDATVSEVELVDGTRVYGPVANRYPYRLAAAMGTGIGEIALVGPNRDQINPEDDYAVSLYPSFGINRYFVGGDVRIDGSISFRTHCVTTPVQASSPIIAFVSAGSRVSGQEIMAGYTAVSAPMLTGPNWSSARWTADADPASYGQVDARHGGKAIAAYLDGSVRLQGVEELRDMRLWCVRAKLANDPQYRVPRTGGGGGGRL